MRINMKKWTTQNTPLYYATNEIKAGYLTLNPIALSI